MVYLILEYTYNIFREKFYKKVVDNQNQRKKDRHTKHLSEYEFFFTKKIGIPIKDYLD